MYYECHVTIDPVLDEENLSDLKDLARAHGFRVAKLITRKGEPSQDDSFMSSSDSRLEMLIEGLNGLLQNLQILDFVKVRRYKIEKIIFDTKVHRDVEKRHDSVLGQTKVESYTFTELPGI